VSHTRTDTDNTIDVKKTTKNTKTDPAENAHVVFTYLLSEQLQPYLIRQKLHDNKKETNKQTNERKQQKKEKKEWPTMDGNSVRCNAQERERERERERVLQRVHSK
jgi:hypothetical protein